MFELNFIRWDGLPSPEGELRCLLCGELIYRREGCLIYLDKRRQHSCNYLQQQFNEQPFSD
jgi:hypothetical protein